MGFAYTDFICATPQPQLTIVMNWCMPGTGNIAASFFGKGGIKIQALWCGIIHCIIEMITQMCLSWLMYPSMVPFLGVGFLFMRIVVWLVWLINFCAVQFHSFTIWKMSRGIYHC